MSNDPQAMRWFLWINEKQEGPFSIGELRSLLESGKISDQTLAFPEHGGQKWCPIIETVPDIFQHAAANEAPKTAQKILVATESGGAESNMDGVAMFCLIVGILGVVVALLLVFTDSVQSKAFWVALGVTSVVNGIVFSIVFKAGAEVIRLLKKSNGLKYSGSISEPSAMHSYKCSACGCPCISYHPTDSCFSCGAKFKSESAAANTLNIDGKE